MSEEVCIKIIKGKKVQGVINPSSGRCVKKNSKVLLTFSPIAPTSTENARCGVGDIKGKGIPKSFGKGKSSIELHEYCRGQYGEDYVSYINFSGSYFNPSLTTKEELGRALCCKKLPSGVTRKEYLKKLSASNEKTRVEMLNENVRLTKQYETLKDAFEECTFHGKCYAVKVNDAKELARGWRIYESILKNHLKHTNACLESVYDPMIGCMRLSQLQAYLKGNSKYIDQAYELLMKAINKITIKSNVQDETSTSRSVLKGILDVVINIGAMLWRNRYTIIIGAIVTTGTYVVVGPGLATFQSVVGEVGVSEATRLAIQQMTSQLCYILAERPMLVQMCVNVIAYKILSVR